MFVVNNPWKGAVHAQDMAIVAPIFHGGELMIWSGALMHMLDIGGLRPGSFCYDATEMYQEGLQLPPTKLVEGGKLRQDIWNLILSHSRMAPTMNLDLKGLMAANLAAARGFGTLIARYGAATVRAVMAGLIRLSEERLRRRLRELPDATIQSVGYIDNHGAGGTIYEVALALTKQDDRLVFDYSASSPQTPGAINCTRSGLMAGSRRRCCRRWRTTSPGTRAVPARWRSSVPRGSICNARKPAAVSGGTLEAVWEVEMTATDALSRLAACSDTYLAEAQAAPAGGPDNFSLSGISHHGERFTQSTLDMLATGGEPTATATACGRRASTTSSG